MTEDVQDMTADISLKYPEIRSPRIKKVLQMFFYNPQSLPVIPDIRVQTSLFRSSSFDINNYSPNQDLINQYALSVPKKVTDFYPFVNMGNEVANELLLEKAARPFTRIRCFMVDKWMRTWFSSRTEYNKNSNEVSQLKTEFLNHCEYFGLKNAEKWKWCCIDGKRLYNLLEIVRSAGDIRATNKLLFLFCHLPSVSVIYMRSMHYT
jgi:hypothetical protein